MRLLTVELRRLIGRRAVVILMLLGVLGIGAITAGILYDHRPVSDADVATAQRQADHNNSSRWARHAVDRCVERSGNVERCEKRVLMDAEDFLWRAQLKPAQYKSWLIPMSALAAAVALLVGATFIGADFASGSLSTQVLFEPSRRKVWLAKTAAVGAATGVFGLLSLAAANATIWLFAKSWDAPFRAGLLGDYSAALSRGVLLAAAAGVGGFALVLLARHTAAALGLLAVYGVAGEAVLRNVWAGSEKWLFSNHVWSWVGGSFKRTLWSNCDGMGECTPDVIQFTRPFAATYLGLVLVVVAIASLLVFRRRDIA